MTVAAMISMNVILFGSITTHLLYAQYDPTTLIKKGNTLFYQGNYTQAMQYYDKALAIDPNIEEAPTGKGTALYGLGNYIQALQYFNKALAIDPNNKVALSGKGASLNRIGHY